MTQRQFTSGEQTTYAATSTNTFTRKRVNLAYNSAGQFAKIIRMSGASGAETETATSVYGYFNGGAVKQIEHWHSGANSASTAPTSLGSSISSYSWTYDTHGRAASFTAPEGTFAYGYDDTHELISATFTVSSGYTGGTPSSENFSFDNTGNRTGSGVSVDKNRLMSDGTYNYTYDGEGNRTSRTNIATTETILYSWDHRNRLTKVEYRNTPTGAATKIVANTQRTESTIMSKLSDILNGSGSDFNDRWNATAAAGEFGPVPRGVYVCHATKGELKNVGKKGTEDFQLEFTIIDGDFKGRKLWLDCWLTPAALPQSKRDLAKLGITSPAQMEQPLPKWIRCNVTAVARPCGRVGGRARLPSRCRPGRTACDNAAVQHPESVLQNPRPRFEGGRHFQTR